METKHTPGPWHVEVTASAINVDSDMGGIAQVFGAESPDDETMPNARLIAAAPELLAALRVTLDALHNETHGDDDSPWMTSVKEQASAAIAKATS